MLFKLYASILRLRMKYLNSGKLNTFEFIYIRAVSLTR